jgi:glycosyltransferase involved in cell wall biosynthesis
MSQEMALISIIIPTYNHARFVTQAVDSALTQTLPAIEVVVVDDGSTDETQGVLAKYKGQINYIYQTNQGPSAARNTGIRAAHGDYLVFLDADDLIPPNKLELQSQYLETRPDWGLVYSGWQYIDETGAQALGEMRPHKQGQVLKDLLCRDFFFSPGAAIIRRECFDRVGHFDVSLRAAEDTDMWVRIAAAGYAFGYVDEILYSYRVVKSGLSHNITNHFKYEFSRLDKFFANPELPEDIKALKPEAYAAILYEYGAKYYRLGEVELAKEHIQKAVLMCPTLAQNEDWLLNWIGGYTSAPEIENPTHLIDFIFSNLPTEATTLRTLRRRAHGRYHTAAIFSAHQSKHPETARHHILPAIMGDPRILWNRGFLRVTLESLFAKRQTRGFSSRRAKQ